MEIEGHDCRAIWACGELRLTNRRYEDFIPAGLELVSVELLILPESSIRHTEGSDFRDKEAFRKRRDARCRACFKKRHGSTARGKKTRVQK